ncbi:Hypothetical predicted protein [Mytilus galloprovincialis]|uniref:B box-type domain-containing protein n=1 Tax=Mytilus galloprovincialis TaxID=29158 RepID=A0A8B6DF82_MYTGA|nr:Hypothetical predicted protein [Mytilus galloprovincialis]
MTGRQQRTTVTISKSRELNRETKHELPRTRRSFVFYCDEHEKPCCAYCFHNAHTRCRNSTPLHTLIKNIKESSSLADLVTTISDLTKNLTNISEDRLKNLQDLVEQKNRIEMKIKTTKEAFNTCLDKLEADLLVKLQKTFIEQELQIQNILKDIELRKSKISEMINSIVKSLASQFQIFMVMREFTHIANMVETHLQRLFDSGSFNWTEILGTQTDIQSVKYHFTSIGEIDVRINPSKIELNVRKSREAQLKGFKRNVQSKVRVCYKINSCQGRMCLYQKHFYRRKYNAKRTEYELYCD